VPNIQSTISLVAKIIIEIIAKNELINNKRAIKKPDRSLA
jgi:hypothetical protein